MLKPDFKEILIQLDGPLWKYLEHYVDTRGVELLKAGARADPGSPERDQFLAEHNALEDFKTRFPSHVRAASATLLEKENE